MRRRVNLKIKEEQNKGKEINISNNKL